MRIAILTVGFAILLPISSSDAGVIYQMRHSIRNHRGVVPVFEATEGNPIHYDYDFQPIDGPGGGSFGEVHATADTGLLHIFDRTFNNGTFDVDYSQTFAAFRFDVTMCSDGLEPIAVALNLDVVGTFTHPNLSSVLIEASSSAGGRQIGSAGGGFPNVGLLNGFTPDGSLHEISTAPFIVPVNTPVSFEIQLILGSQYHPASPIADYTLRLAQSRDLFEVLTPGVPVTFKSSDVEIRSHTVPEPSTLAILGGMAMVGFSGRRRR